MDGFTLASQHRALTTEDYWFDIDVFRRGQDTLLLAHLRFASFSPSIFRRVKHEWQAFRQCVAAPVFALGEVDDDKWARFVTHLGFRFSRQVICNNGESRRLFVHVQPGCEPQFKDGDAQHDHDRFPQYLDG